MSRTESIEIRVTTSKKKAFRVAAEYSGIPMSAWIRERLRQSATKELEAESQQVPFYQHVLESCDVHV